MNRFAVVTLDALVWPDSLKIPSPRFRLFVAAETTELTVDELSRFAETALRKGMVYFCAWGPGCERFHDVVDEVLVGDEVFGKGRFTPPTPEDTVITTWHRQEDLEEALDFFGNFANPTDGYAVDSDYRIVICVSHPEWAKSAGKFLEWTLR